VGACYKQATPLGFLLATLDGAKHVPEGRGAVALTLYPTLSEALSKSSEGTSSNPASSDPLPKPTAEAHY